MTDEQETTTLDPTVPTALSDQDKMTLELSKSQLQVAQANVGQANSANDAANYAHRYLVLQLYVKYGLDLEKDGINEKGEIVRNYPKGQ